MKRWSILLAAGILAAAGAMSAAAGEMMDQKDQDQAVKKVYTINHSLGDGQKVTSVVLEYGAEIDAESISPDVYEVENRTVTAVHTNSEAAETDEDIAGPFVVLDLEVQSPLLEDRYATDGRIDHGAVIDSAVVWQKEDIKAADGTVIPASEEAYASSSGDGGIMGNDAVKTPDMDRFEDNHYYNDPETHVILHYNFFKPEGYEESGEKYPLVLFIPDASAVGKDWETVLQCGNGGTIWAEDAWQTEHPCFIVTMIYEDKYINDYNEYYESWLTGTMGLIRQIAAEYPVDENRIYTTGTSMGAMASMLMMEEDPELFAAAYMVAGQWRDTEAVKDIKDQNILFLMSQDDPSYSRAADNVDTWEREGGVVARGDLDATASAEDVETMVNDLLAQEANIYFMSILEGHGSVDLEGNPLKGGHRATFRVAYDLPEVKEWLFEQTK